MAVERSRHLRLIRARWKLVSAAALVGLTIAAAVTLQVTPRYETTAQLFVTTSEVSDGAETDIVVRDNVPVYIALAGTRFFSAAVVARMDDPAVGIGDVADHLETVVQPSSVILNMRVTAGSALLAQTVANAAAEEMITQIAARGTVDPTGPDVRAVLAASAPLPGDPRFPDPMVSLPLGLILG
ncbi:MAG: hypothetical protein H0T85_04350, partial [Geodermatophilaceae bacterium]|nr:hypothetical protein [Geodermatophilaceae bacterium]